MLAAAAAWVPFAPWRGASSTRFWRAYRPLLVRANVALARGTATISAAFGQGVVSEAAASVEFWDFSALARVPFSEVSTRFDPLDPRFDAWMAGGGRFFHTASRSAEWQVLYVPATSTLPSFWLEAARRLGIPWHGEWRIPELDPLEKLPALGALAAFTGLLGLSLRNGRRTGIVFALAGGALCAALVTAGGRAALAACLIVLVAWSRPLRLLVDRRPGRPLRSIELRRPLVLYVAASTAAALLLVLSRPPGSASLVGFLGVSVGLLLLLASLTMLRGSTGRQGRSVFEPVPIVRPSADRHPRLPAAPLAASVLLVLCALAPLARRELLPVPSFVPGAREYSWKSLAALVGFRGPSSLPDLADLVTHEAYQETIAFGRAWKLPVSGERVYAREFITSRATGTIAERLRTVKVFDQAWLESVRTRAVAGSLESMLFAQRRPVVVAMRGPGGRLLPELPAALAGLFALLSILGGGLERRPSTVRRIRRTGTPVLRGLPLIRAIYLRFNTLARRSQVP